MTCIFLTQCAVNAALVTISSSISYCLLIQAAIYPNWFDDIQMTSIFKFPSRKHKLLNGMHVLSVFAM